MASHHTPKHRFDAEATYRITVLGRLGPEWSDYLGGMAITTETRSDSETETTLAGSLLDQAALAGVLNTLYDRGFTLLSVQRLAEEETRTAA